MENLFLFLATRLVLRANAPRFKRYVILPGLSALLNSGSKTLHVRLTKEGDKLYFNDYTANGVTYGLVCAKMSEVYTLHQAEDILVQFMNRMRKPLHIACNAGMVTEGWQGHLCITDYWQDEAGTDWKVKGYTNGQLMTVTYVKNISDTTVVSHDAFLNGIRFSGMGEK